MLVLPVQTLLGLKGGGGVTTIFMNMPSYIYGGGAAKFLLQKMLITLYGGTEGRCYTDSLDPGSGGIAEVLTVQVSAARS